MAVPASRKNLSLAVSLTAFALGMVMLAYASVPLYKLFCQVTGLGGTTQTAGQAPAQALTQRVRVDFDTNTRDGLPWTFTAEQKQLDVAIGASTFASFQATNTSDKPVTGMAVYNVTPHLVGPYFMKTECFCYNAQTIQPGQTVHFPVSFYLDPALADDPDLRGLTNITLSYTFFPVKPEDSAK